MRRPRQLADDLDRWQRGPPDRRPSDHAGRAGLALVPPPAGRRFPRGGPRSDAFDQLHGSLRALETGGTQRILRWRSAAWPRPTTRSRARHWRRSSNWEALASSRVVRSIDACSTGRSRTREAAFSSWPILGRTTHPFWTLLARGRSFPRKEPRGGTEMARVVGLCFEESLVYWEKILQKNAVESKRAPSPLGDTGSPG